MMSLKWRFIAELALAVCLFLGFSSCQNLEQQPAQMTLVRDHRCPFEAGACAHCENLKVSQVTTSAPTSSLVDDLLASTPMSNTEVSSMEETTSMSEMTSSKMHQTMMTEVSEPVWKRIQANKKIVIGVKADAPPFGVLRDDGQFWGFEVDLSMAIGERLGLEVELVPVTAKKRIPYLLQDRVDLIVATMTMTQKREEVVDFSLPYFEVGQGLITRSDSDIQSFRDLKGRKVAVLEGTQAFHTLRRLQPDCFLIIVDSYAKGIDTVLKKETEALCSDHLLLMGLLHEHGEMSQLSLVEETFAPDPYAIAMKENESSLRDAVNESLMKLWEQSIWQDTYETWFGLGSMYGHDLIFRIDMIPE